jgi:hypothetical protein
MLPLTLTGKLESPYAEREPGRQPPEQRLIGRLRTRGKKATVLVEPSLVPEPRPTSGLPSARWIEKLRPPILEEEHFNLN